MQTAINVVSSFRTFTVSISSIPAPTYFSTSRPKWRTQPPTPMQLTPILDMLRVKIAARVQVVGAVKVANHQADVATNPDNNGAGKIPIPFNSRLMPKPLTSSVCCPRRAGPQSQWATSSSSISERLAVSLTSFWISDQCTSLVLIHHFNITSNIFISSTPQQANWEILALRPWDIIYDIHSLHTLLDISLTN